MFSFEEFKEAIRDEVIELLPEEYKSYECKFATVQKVGYEYVSLTISKSEGGTKIAPALDITAAYEDYKSGKSMSSIAERLAAIQMVSMPRAMDFDKEMLLDYERCKSRIYPRLINRDANRSYIDGKPHKDVEDLSIVYAVRINEDSEGFAEAVITDDLLECWGNSLTVEDIHRVAFDNVDSNPFFIKNIFDVIIAGPDCESGSIDDLDLSDNVVPPMFVLSNVHKCNGAVIVCDDRIMTKVHDRLGDMYVIPSSVDEVIVIPKTIEDDVERLAQMVKSVNEESVPDRKKLSDNVYEWTVEEGFKMV